MKRKITLLLLGVAAGVGLYTNASATQVQVTVENLGDPGGLYFTPVWVGFHDGNFDSFNVGDPASSSLEALAEGGDPGDPSVPTGIRGDFTGVAGGQDGVVVAPAGFAGAPVFDPGDSGSLTFNLDPTNNRYFSFASMIIPSNDAFIGNEDPMAHEIFDVTGVFAGPLDILVLSTDVWDAGTEVNDGLGAPFLLLTGISTDEMGQVGRHPGIMDMFIPGGETVAGTFIDPRAGDFGLPGYQLARITINQVAEPQIMAVFGLGLGLMTVVGRRRRLGGKDRG